METYRNCINLYRATNFFLYPLKTSKIVWFSDVLGWDRKRPVVEKGYVGTLHQQNAQTMEVLALLSVLDHSS